MKPAKRAFLLARIDSRLDALPFELTERVCALALDLPGRDEELLDIIAAVRDGDYNGRYEEGKEAGFDEGYGEGKEDGRAEADAESALKAIKAAEGEPGDGKDTGK
jgi:hypothetical protein